jgi:hypothetical protein
MISKIREILSKVDNHTDLFDEFAEKVDNTIRALRRHYGY